VKVYKNVTDSVGRTGIAVGQTWNGIRRELIFDPKTYELLGESEVADYNDDFQPSGGSTPKPSASPGSPSASAAHRLKQGQLLYSSANLDFALVDRVGQKS
jgi:hypothetical protein